MLYNCPNIPKIIERESELPEGMTSEELSRALNPGWLALVRLFAHHEMQLRSKHDGRKQDNYPLRSGCL